MHLRRLLDSLQRFRRFLRCPVDAQLRRCYPSPSLKQETQYYPWLVLDEGRDWFYCEWDLLRLYRCFYHYLLFSICDAGGCCYHELCFSDYWRVFIVRLGILVREAEGLRGAEAGGFGYRGFGEGCLLRCLKPSMHFMAKRGWIYHDSGMAHLSLDLTV